ncbi:DUF3261 domain-containing protein [Pseudomonas stutzeri]|uniref:DUF3261 domain-containing protein n=1 Tax=Stutzerimonas stutzeri TaxID=316 RepID=UPI00210B961C|nr:DUF3261 domain-containing protein [Stutzerimonas stutzeri]MCQ4312542.1 DUF3261 domain-containing protein [Stutzerimonas stutzeri]
MRALIWLPLLLSLAACAQRLPLPTQTPELQLPLQLHIQRHGFGESQDWLLVIQQDGAALRWSLLDPLGIPLARQLLSDGEWQADGLLPPNPEARELFAALLFALTPAEQLSTLYANTQWSQQENERTMRHDASSPWRVRYRQNDRFELDVGPALTYRVAPIAAAAGTRH